ncbi:hypothetical protein C8Q74DRAFT_727206 [Fomes fomentarius]|nr:hypothetical protein C8Q74DRAFT_727206 [Fomes fomentarius]
MPGDAVHQIPPQLPALPSQPSLALPPQPSLASTSHWKLHYPPDDVQAPPTSCSTTSTSHPALRPSNSPSPPRLPDPLEQVAGDPTSQSPAGVALFSKSHSRSHSRSNSRVPIPVLPSASSPELIMITLPVRTHSRSISVGLPKTPRPSTADKDKDHKDRDQRRPPKVSKEPPPPLPLLGRPPLSLPDPNRSQWPMRDQSLPASAPKPVMPVTSPEAATLPATLPTTVSAPPRPPLKRFHSLKDMSSSRKATNPASDSSPSPPLPPNTPQSAPVRKTDEREKLRERVRTRSNARKEKERELRVPQPEESFLNLNVSDSARAPIRAPTPPKPRPTAHTIHVTPSSRANRQPMLSSWTQSENPIPERAVATPVPVRGRTVETAVAVRTSPKVDSDSAPTKTQGGYARKWVLEKNGKRLTQDTVVIAQQLRMLR